ncbi:MAG: pitrilysin family protein [Pseudomonadota bacterium]
MKIQQVTSPGGIKAWLVEDHNVPLVTMEFAFLGGAVQDPDDKKGVAYFVSGMLDEGAGDIGSKAFQEKKEDLAFRMSFDAMRDVFSGSFQTLTEKRDESFKMLRLALTKPRFDQDAIERIRKQITSGLKFDANDPSKVASKNWIAAAFGQHPYAKSTKGSEKTLKAITQNDLQDYVKRIFAKENLYVAVVGDIDAKTLGEVLDKTFGDLPKKPDLKNISEAESAFGPQEKVIEMNVPQSVVKFGHQGLKRKDTDFVPAYILNYVIGGGGFNSRLLTEVREKRGLAYSVYSYLSPYNHGALFAGGVATENKSVRKAIGVIKDVIADVAKNGPTEEEVEGAKQYLTGSYALRFDTSPKIASQLLWIQIEDLGIDYIEKRNSLIEAVTQDDLKRVAQEMLKPEKLIITIVGKPAEEG